MTPKVESIYEILIQWAKGEGPQSYMALSQAYQKRTDEWFDPHGSWRKPLGILNVRLSKIGAPALSSLVIIKGKNEPGDGFWGCADNVPLKPKSDSELIEKWMEIVDAVQTYNWPESLPE